MSGPGFPHSWASLLIRMTYTPRMRDLRDDFRERLDAITGERLALETKLAEVRQREDRYKMLLREEEERCAASSAGAAIALSVSAEDADPDANQNLASLIMTTMRSKNRPLDLDEIKREMGRTHFDFGTKAPGRAIHFRLIGLLNRGEVGRLADGRWTLANGKVPVQEAQPAH